MKMMQILKNRKGFTLMELIVVLIIIAILMAALLPSLIGWINDARESALRVDGRTALLAVQGVVTEARGTGYWNTIVAGERVRFTTVNRTDIENDTKFIALINEADIYPDGVFNGGIGGAPGIVASPATDVENVSGLILEGDNVIGIIVFNTVGSNRNSDGIGTNLLLIGRMPGTAGGGGDDGGGDGDG